MRFPSYIINGQYACHKIETLRLRHPLPPGLPVKYCKSLLDTRATASIAHTLKEIELRYELTIEQMGDDKNHIHLLVSFHPKYSIGEVVRKLKSITARELFKELPGPDEQIIQRVHIPSNESGQEFDDQILGLTKAVIDSLNERGIVGELGATVPDEKGIQKLERFFQAKNYPHADRDLSILRELQSLRSRNAAHRRSSDYREHLDGVLNGRSHSEYVRDLLVSLNTMLADFVEFFVNEQVEH